MQTSEFRKLFKENAKRCGFKLCSTTCYIESDEILTGLDFYKSNFSNIYYFSIKIFVKKMYNFIYEKKSEIISIYSGSFVGVPPKEYTELFDLENAITDEARSKKLEELFSDFIGPLCKQALSQKGIEELVNSRHLPLMKMAKEELERMGYHFSENAEVI